MRLADVSAEEVGVKVTGTDMRLTGGRWAGRAGDGEPTVNCGLLELSEVTSSSKFEVRVTVRTVLWPMVVSGKFSDGAVSGAVMGEPKLLDLAVARPEDHAIAADDRHAELGRLSDRRAPTQVE